MALITTALFFIGFYILVKGSNVLIDGASSIARVLKVSSWVIGVVIVGIGTSIPEFSINLASLSAGNSIGISTIIGSNTFNLLFILGLVAIIAPPVMEKRWVWRDFIINIAVVLLSIFFLLMPVLGDPSFAGLTKEEGIILFFLFLAWLTYMASRRTAPVSALEADSGKTFTIWTSLGMIGVGLVGVFIGGRWVVSGAEFFAHAAGVKPYIVGLTIVGIGTSLPELFVSITAAFRRRSSIAVGNIIGSNVFDFLGILGIASFFGPLPFGERLIADISFTVFAALALFAAMFMGKRYVLKRWQGVIFVLLYLAYFLVIFLRAPI